MTYTTINDPFTTVQNTAAYGINDKGQIVGYYQNSSYTFEGFLYSSGTYTTLYDPSATFDGGTSADGINDKGQIVGYYGNDSGAHGFLYNHGHYVTLNDLHGTKGTFANGINDNGQIVGYYLDSNGVEHGFIYDRLTHTYKTLNDPFAGTENGEGTEAQGINDKGQIVGSYIDSKGAVHGFLYSHGHYIALNDPSAGRGTLENEIGTVANGINDKGQVVGSYTDDNGVAHGFVYNISTGIYATLDDPSAGPGSNDTAAFGINDKGQIVGWYWNGGANGFLYSDSNSGATSEIVGVLNAPLHHLGHHLG